MSKNMKKVVLTTLSGAILFSNMPLNAFANTLDMQSTTSEQSKNSIVSIPDPNLKAALINALNKTDENITQADMESLTSFDASNKNITNLTGLEYAVNLTLINLSNNHIYDRSPLKNLSKVIVLDISNQFVYKTINLYNNQAQNPFQLANGHYLSSNTLPEGLELNEDSSVFSFKNPVKGQTYTFETQQVSLNGHTVIVEVNLIIEDILGVPTTSTNKIPVITAQNVDLTVGQTFNPLDYVTAYDEEDGQLEATVISDTVNTAVPGIYEVIYQATDSNGASVTKKITVTVNPLPLKVNQAPIIEALNVSIPVGYELDLLSLANAYDEEDGQLTPEILFSNLDNTKSGIYEVIYGATDSEGATVRKSITIKVKDLETNLENGRYSRIIETSKDSEFNLDTLLDTVALELGLTQVEVIDGEVEEDTPGDYELTIQGVNTAQEREIHNIMVRIINPLDDAEQEVEAEQDQKTEDEKIETEEKNVETETDTSVKNPEVIETGLQTGLFLGLGAMLEGAGLLLLKRKRK